MFALLDTEIFYNIVLLVLMRDFGEVNLQHHYLYVQERDTPSCDS